MGCTHSNEKPIVNIEQSQLNDEYNHSEILDWYQIFIEKYGTDNNLLLTSYINKSLFINYFNQLYPNGDVTRLTESFFCTYDLNNDGIIDFMEFINVINIIRRDDLREKLSFIFSLLDSDKKGYIDRLKLVQMMEALYNIKGIDYTDGYNILLRKVDRILIRLNKNKEEDGRIYKNKFIENCINDSILKDSLNE